MLTTILTGLWSRKRRLFGTVTAVVLGVAFLAATLVIGDTQRADFSQAFTTANAGTDVIVRSADEISGESSGPRAHRRRPRRPGRQPWTVSPRRSPRSRASPRSSDQTATALVATVLPPPPPTGWTIRSSTPTGWPKVVLRGPTTRAAPQGPSHMKSSSTAPRHSNGDLAVGDRTTVLTPEPVEVTIVGIATFGDADSLGPITYTAFTLPAAQELLAGRPDAISSVLVAAEDGVSAGDAPRRDHAADAGPHRGPDARRAHRGAGTGDRERLPRRVQHDAARLRRHRHGRRRVQHPQHVLDPRRPAHEGVRAAAGDRRLSAPGRGRRRPRGARGRHRRHGDRLRRWDRPRQPGSSSCLRAPTWR